MPATFKVGDMIKLPSGQMGEIVKPEGSRYLVKYKNENGSWVENWWHEGTIALVKKRSHTRKVKTDQ